ncbi:hypothetical protein RclHR1_36950001 [Rhizophagus clarus]|uniref:PAZ domain-containing protein n=1 Tax=Rhizophagus clarus TaxID=94130 RepID=A0A2Z6RP06_9GLOM|nr:hypothetical protein RclHR1_36950001 [Rhizophagus clarus]
MINVDLTAAAFCESGPLVNIVVKLLGKQSQNDLSGGINEKERNRLEKELKNYQIRVIHRKINQYYHILKITPQDAQETKFNDADGHIIDVASYFQKNINTLIIHIYPVLWLKKKFFFQWKYVKLLKRKKRNRLKEKKHPNISRAMTSNTNRQTQRDAMADQPGDKGICYGFITFPINQGRLRSHVV